MLHHLTRPDIRKQFDQSLQQMPLETTTIAWVGSKENSEHQGKTLANYIAERGTSAGDALADLLIEENLAVLLVLTAGNDDLIDPFLSHPNFMLGTDGILHEPLSILSEEADTETVYGTEPALFSMEKAAPSASINPRWIGNYAQIHPRQYGSAARVLGPAVRVKQLFSLEEAVYKLSGYPAARFGAKHRGEVRVGWFADVVVFDAETITDRATYADPHQHSIGVDHVLVNGRLVITNGAPVPKLGNPLPGRSLKFKE